jgi:hypothetical protein
MNNVRTTETLKKRTWHYIQKPIEYEITCDKCGGHNTWWSEFEGMIWCYDCKVDTRGTPGIFDGPIPVGVCSVLGISFDRLDMTTGKVMTWDENKQEYVSRVIQPEKVVSMEDSTASSIESEET